jgi:AcrR family transcriptional regulator
MEASRPYRSKRRTEQAAATRGRILEAATRLFAERGFESTTVTAIAAAAGVSDETVYAAFRTKRGLLGELVRSAVRGESDLPVAQQPAARAVESVADQREQLRLFAGDVAKRLERVAPLIDVLAAAARTNPELAELQSAIDDSRAENLGLFVDALAARGSLRLGRTAAVEEVWTLASPELHTLLRGRRGWSRARYQRWLADSLARLLLPGE